MLKYLLLIALLHHGLCVSVGSVGKGGKDVKGVGVGDPVVDAVKVAEEVTDEVKVNVEEENVKEVVKEVMKDVVEEVVKEVVQQEVKEEVEKMAKPVEDKLVEEEPEENKEDSGKDDLQTSRDVADVCTVGSDYGYCYNVAYCTRINGRNLDNRPVFSSHCSSIGKICCQPTYTCGDKTKTYVAIFNPGKAGLKGVTDCELRVDVADDSICQIKIDFDQFTLSQPTQSPAGTAMQCNLDTFTVQGPKHPVPKLCGILDGQHIYLHINQTKGEKSVNLIFSLADRTTSSGSTGLVDNPNFELRVTQLQCPTKTASYLKLYDECATADFNILAPPGCLQYFTGDKGTVKSFTYDSTRALSANTQLANLDYAICFKKLPSSGCIKFTAPYFSMSGRSGRCVDRIACTELMIGDGAAPSLVDNREICATMMTTTALMYCPGETVFALKIRTDDKWDNAENGFVFNFENPPSGACPAVK